MKSFVTAIVAVMLTAAHANAADLWRLKEGTPELQSAGTLASGPDGILFVGDQKSATVFAIGTGDSGQRSSNVSLNVPDLAAAIGKTLDVAAQDVSVDDLAMPTGRSARFH